jgi:DNA-binding NarL/FixJ family response regulator
LISILIADDQALVASGFRAILDAQPDMEVVAEVADGWQAVEAARRLQPDVALLDVRMPVVDGLQATRRIVAAQLRTRVVILTTFDLDEYVWQAVRAGASGFLLKDVRREQLIVGIRAAAAGETIVAPAIARRLVEQFGRLPEPGTKTPAVFDSLSEREFDVLRLLARGLSNAEIAAQLFLSPATVKTHVAALLAKLDLRDRIQAVIAAYESGLIVPGEARD